MKSGKRKTELRQIKKANESRVNHSSSSDTPLGTVGAFMQTAANQGSAHVVLSVGSRA